MYSCSCLCHREFADWLARALFARRLKASELARKIGVSQPLVSMWSNGSRVPRRHDILAIGLVLGFKLDFVNEGLLAAGLQALPEGPQG